MTEERDDLYQENKNEQKSAAPTSKRRPSNRKGNSAKSSNKAQTQPDTDSQRETSAEAVEKQTSTKSIAKKTAKTKKTEPTTEAILNQEDQPASETKNTRARRAKKSNAEQKKNHSNVNDSSLKKEITDTTENVVEKAVESEKNISTPTVEAQADRFDRKTDTVDKNKGRRKKTSSLKPASDLEATQSGDISKNDVASDDIQGADSSAKKKRTRKKSSAAKSAETDSVTTISEVKSETDGMVKSTTAPDISSDDTKQSNQNKKRRSRKKPSTTASQQEQQSAANVPLGRHSDAGESASAEDVIKELDNAIENISADTTPENSGQATRNAAQSRRKKKPRKQTSPENGENIAENEKSSHSGDILHTAASASDIKPDTEGKPSKSAKDPKAKTSNKKGRSIRDSHNNRIEEVRAAAEASAKLSKELIINSTPSEITIALMEDKQLVELNKEKCKTGFSVGDIYLGKVRKIMPGLNAAFVSIGHEKDAFMHYLDLGLNFTSLHKLTSGLVANKKLPQFDKLKFDPPIGKNGKISNCIAVGQPIIVQIAKEAISTKGPRLTSEISLAGRHVVLIPLSNKISISQKIRSNEEKRRLKRIAESALPNNYGVIIRTAAVGKSDEDITNDIRFLVERWELAMSKVRGEQPPTVLLTEINRATAIIRDLLSVSFNSITVDEPSMYEDIREYIKQIAPEKEKIVKLYKGNVPIFDNFDISKQIQGLFAKYVSLKKGAYLIVEHTEALHVVDVNSGNRAKVDDDQEHTAMNVNLAAAEEIARQLRLRDMGGIIVIDFIDLHKGDNRQLLYDKMTKFMSSDRAKHTILPLSKFGLMQITRQRVRPEAIAESTETCPACKGTGVITPTALLDQQIENQVAYFALERGVKYLKLKVSPYVAAFLTKGIFPVSMRWQLKYRCRIKVVTDQSTGFIETKFFDKNDNELI